MSTTTAADRLLPLLDHVRACGSDAWIAPCPSHQDKRPSLTIRQIHDRCLIKCFAGCTAEAITAAMGVTLRDLFDDSEAARPDAVVSERRRISRGFQKWRADETLRTALELRSRDNWILAVTASVDLGLVIEDEAGGVAGDLP